MSTIGTLAQVPRATFEFANVILTTRDAPIGQTPRDVVWTHRGTTLYRYRSEPSREPGSMANKLMKPVTKYATTYRRLFQSLLDGSDPRLSYQAVAKWVADNPPFPSRAYREWITWMYKEDRLVAGRLRLRGEHVDLARMEQSLLVVTAGADHIAPREGTVLLLDLVSRVDVTHLDRPGGRIGLMAGSKAKHEVWPELADWLRERSGH